MATEDTDESYLNDSTSDLDSTFSEEPGQVQRLSLVKYLSAILQKKFILHNTPDPSQIKMKSIFTVFKGFYNK